MKGRLLALSSAAVMTVYAAGYARTRSAAELLDAEERRPPMPRPGDVDRTPIPAPPAEATLVTAPAAPATSAIVVNRTQPVPAPRAAGAANPEAAPAAVVADVPSSAASASAVPSVATVPAPSAAVTPAAPDAASAPAAAALVASSAPAAPFASAPVAPFAASAAAAPAGAVASAVVPAAPPAPSLPRYKDGHYTGWGRSRHGDLQASIWIEGGRISTASIAQCQTRYPCDWIVKLPPQVIQRQSAEVDYVSGATESATAFYYAVLEALAKAAQ